MKRTFEFIFTVLLLVLLISSLASCDDLANLVKPSEECAHAWRDASCTAPKTCKKCLMTEGEALPHSYSKAVVEATCIKNGYTEYTCEVCGDNYRKNPVNAVGHTVSDWIFDKQATETEPGEKHRECLSCGVIIEKETVAPHTHTMQSVSSLKPTCDSDGYNAHERCSICGYSEDYLPIPALGHYWGAWTSNGDGTHTHVCLNDETHVVTEYCSGGELGTDPLICTLCGGEYDYAPTSGNSRYGYDALGKYAKGEQLQALYKQLQVGAEAFAISEDNVSEEDGYYIIGEYDYAALSLTSDEAMGVWKIFYIDNPSYYWLSSVAVTRGDDILLSVSRDYIYSEYRAEYNNAINAMVASCRLLITPDMSELEKAVKIAEFIVSNMEYAYEEDGVTPVDDAWAHNMVGFVQYNLGVCESYSKTFMYLCLLNDIDCIMGSGYGDGDKHVWNYVSIDGVWYGVDLTWTDTEGSAARFDRFGMSDSLIHSDHTLHSTESFGVDFTYAIPEISDTSIELTELFKNGKSQGLYTSIETAMLAITDADAEYEIYIGFYGDFVGAQEHTLKITETPNVKKLTFSGLNKFGGEAYLDHNSVLNIEADLKLNGNVEFKNLELKGEGTVDLNNCKLTLSGATVYFGLKITGNTEGSEIEVLVTRHAYLNASVDVYLITVGDKTLVFAEDSTVHTFDGESLYTSNGATVNVTNRI